LQYVLANRGEEALFVVELRVLLGCAAELFGLVGVLDEVLGPRD
jgi:hypothetical protein